MSLDPSALKTLPLFSGFSESELEGIGALAASRVVPKNHVIFNNGDEADALYILASGRVKVFKINDLGREAILAVLGSGDFFGEMSLFDDQPRSASVQSLEACSLILLPKQAFLDLLRQNLDSAMVVIKALISRLRAADDKIEELALVDVYGRVARLLVQRCRMVGDEFVISPPPQKTDIARSVGASRETVSRIMSDLERRGAIRSDKKQLVILGDDVFFGKQFKSDR